LSADGFVNGQRSPLVAARRGASPSSPPGTRRRLSLRVLSLDPPTLIRG